nr:MAG TPA: hypothetical protein [Caudoviricetes sp.]DAS64386.1 MAG TPA: hypothetical protein [Caudoviricetes sp.]
MSTFIFYEDLELDYFKCVNFLYPIPAFYLDPYKRIRAGLK